jgi:hypothetical protein
MQYETVWPIRTLRHVRFGWILLGLLLALTLPACAGHSSGTKPTLPANPIRLQIACPNPLLEQMLGHFGKLWPGRDRVQWQLSTYDPAAAWPESDVLVLAASDVPAAVLAGRAAPVPERLTSEQSSTNWRGVSHLLRTRLCVWDGKVYALPLVGGGVVVVYRKDVYAEAKHRAAYQARCQRELAAPRTWEEFVEQAEYFRDALGRPSLPGQPAAPLVRAAEFNRIAANFVVSPVSESRFRQRNPTEAEVRAMFSFHFDIDTGQSRLETAGFVRALQLQRRLDHCRPDAKQSKRDEFRTGQAVLAVVNLAELSQLAEPGNACTGKFALTPLLGSEQVATVEGDRLVANSQPTAMPTVGDAVFCAVVRPGLDDAAQTEAFDFLAWLSSPPPEGKAIEIVSQPIWGAGPWRDLQLDASRRAIWNAYNLDATNTTLLIDSLRQQLAPAIVNPVLCLRVPDARERLVILGEELTNDPQRPPAQTLAAVNARWQTLDRRVDGPTRIRQIRQAAGL